MTHRIVVAMLSLLLIAAPGCVCSKAKDQVDVSASKCDTYAELVEATLDGSLPKQDGQVVTEEDLAKTPDSVKALLQNVITAVYVCRKGFHQLRFAIADGPDPDKLGLDTIPRIK